MQKWLNPNLNQETKHKQFGGYTETRLQFFGKRLILRYVYIKRVNTVPILGAEIKW